MPRGVYERGILTQAQKNMMSKNLAMGRTKKARAKAAVSLRVVWDDENKRQKTSEENKKKMHDPKIRAKHLAGLDKSREESGSNLKGGNGRVPVKTIRKWSKILLPAGFLLEHTIKTKGHDTGLKCPDNYKVDFGRERDKIAIEFDGTYHRSFEQKKKDHKKSYILEQLGWTVYRIKHT